MTTSDDKIQKIALTLQHLATAVKSDRGLENFDNVEIPFQLTQACIQLWADCFSIPSLQSLANADPDALEAWAIALNTTLQTELGILNQWLPLLSIPSLPAKLREKAQQRTSELHQIANQKATLLQAAPKLLAQETELRNAAAELLTLRAKVDELKGIETEVSRTDLAKLRAEVLQKETELLPLYEQKADIEKQIAYWHQQQQILEQEIEQQKSRQEQQKLGILNQIHKLLNLTETAKSELSIPLATALENLESQRNEYNQQWEHLQESIIAYNQYRKETETICADLNAHYQIDAVLQKRLPINRHRMETLIQTIQQSLTELDRELKAAQTQNERSQQKQYITFGT